MFYSCLTYASLLFKNLRNSFLSGVISGCLLTILFIILIVLLIVSLKIRYIERKYIQRYFYQNNITSQKVHQGEPYQRINSLSTLLPIRSYLNYLQLCYYYNYNSLSSSKRKNILRQDIVDQLKFLVENNDEFIDYLFKLTLQSNNKTVLNSLVLTQRYNFKKLFKLNHPLIYFNICILTSYETFLISQTHSLLSQLYSRLKLKIHSGPIDAIEQLMSYYSLNIDTLLHDDSSLTKTIQLIVHIDLNDNNSNNLLLNVTCLTCDTISQVKRKILDQLNLLNRISINECKLYLLTSHSCSNSSSSSTASSSVPLTRKSILTKVLLNRTVKYVTTAINDPYRDSHILLLNDIDDTNEQIHNWKRLNTLQHYGIITEGYEVKLIISSKEIGLSDYNVDFSKQIQMHLLFFISYLIFSKEAFIYL